MKGVCPACRIGKEAREGLQTCRHKGKNRCRAQHRHRSRDRNNPASSRCSTKEGYMQGPRKIQYTSQIWEQRGRSIHEAGLARQSRGRSGTGREQRMKTEREERTGVSSTANSHTHRLPWHRL